MATLNRAVAFAQPDALAVLVGQNLDFDVARPLDGAFEINRSVAERGSRFAHRLPESSLELGRVAHHAQALAAAASDRFQSNRKADVVGCSAHVLDRLKRFKGARDDGYASGLHQFARLSLEPEIAHRLGRRSDKDQPSIDARLGETSVLGQKAIPRMDSVHF